MLSVFIPTRGRIDKQTTMKSFQLRKAAAILEWISVIYVVPRCESKAFKRTYPWARVRSVPDDWKTGSINQFIAEQPGNNKVYIDDDFTLARRRDPESTSQAGATVKDFIDVVSFFCKIDQWFEEGYAHGAVSMRQANHYNENLFQENGRACGLVFYRTDVLAREGIRFDAVQEHQAYHVTLSLLELGYLNVVDYEYMFGHQGTNAAGGCSVYRTVEYLEAQNRILQALHPRSVGLFYRKLKGEAAASIATEQGVPAVKVGWAKSVGIRANERKMKNLKGLKCIG